MDLDERWLVSVSEYESSAWRYTLYLVPFYLCSVKQNMI